MNKKYESKLQEENKSELATWMGMNKKTVVAVSEEQQASVNENGGNIR